MQEFLDIEKTIILYDYGLKPKRNTQLVWVKTVTYFLTGAEKDVTKWKIIPREDSDQPFSGFRSSIMFPVYTVDVLLDLFPDEILMERGKEGGMWKVSCFGKEDIGFTGETLLDALWKLIEQFIDLGIL